MNDKTPGACQCHEKHAPTYWKGVVREYKVALEKAVRERDAALADAESHPLTPDAITDEAMRRAVKAWEETGELRPAIFAAITAPARPEGAEKVEAVLHQYWSGDIDGDDLADRIAEEMNR